MTIELRITAESVEDLQAQLAAIAVGPQLEVQVDSSALGAAKAELAEIKAVAKQEKAATKKKAADKVEEKPEPVKEVEDKPAPAKEETVAKQPSLEDVREVMGKAVQAGQKDTIKELFEQFGASKLSELEAKDYADFVTGLEAVL